MSETRRKKVLYVLLIGAIAFGVYNFSQPRKHYVPGSMPQPEQEAAVTAPVVSAQPPVNIEAIKKASWGRDPFRWSSRPEPRQVVSQNRSVRPSTSGWNLSAILFSTSMPLAVVNGKTVRVGDIVDQAKVVKIERKKVTLQYNGATIEIQVRKG
jgi:hypothetical protein